MGATPSEVILPIVPMFHANAWGIAFGGPAAGPSWSCRARRWTAPVYELIETEGVTFSAAVPTVWQGLYGHMVENGLKFSTLRKVLIGGSACPEALIRGFQDHLASRSSTPGA